MPCEALALPSAARPRDRLPHTADLGVPAQRTGVTNKIGKRGAPTGTLSGTSCFIPGMAVHHKKYKSRYGIAINCCLYAVRWVGGLCMGYGWVMCGCVGMPVPLGNFGCPLVLQRTTTNISSTEYIIPGTFFFFFVPPPH